jgi:hypothetical protein
MDSSRGLAATTRTMAVPAPLQDDGRRRQRRTPTRSTRRGELDDGPLREIRIEGHVLRDKLYMVQRRGKRLTTLQSHLATALRVGIRALLDLDEQAHPV